MIFPYSKTTKKGRIACQASASSLARPAVAAVGWALFLSFFIGKPSR